MLHPSRCIVILGIILALAAAGCREQTQDEILAEGGKLLSEGNAKGAAVVFKNLLEKSPQNSTARFELAKAYLEIGKPEQAEKEVQRLAELPEPPERLPMLRGRIKLAQNKPDEALAEFNTYLAVNPQSAEAWEFSGQAYVGKNQLTRAVDAFEQALAFNPDRANARLALIESRLKLNQIPEAKGQLDILFSKKPNDQAGLHLLAQVQTKEEDFTASIDTYGLILAQYPHDERARYQQAFQLLTAKGNRSAAEEAAKILMKELPNQPEGYRLQGMVEFIREAYPKAVTNFQQAVKMRPTLENHYLLALAYERNGNLETALSELRIILDVAPRSSRVRQMVANLHLRLNRPDEAIAELQKLLQFAPNDPAGALMLGDIYLSRQDLDKSLEMYSTIVETSSQASLAHIKAGVILAHQNKNAEAEAELRKAVELSGSSLEPRLTLAMFLRRQQRLDDAAAVLDINSATPAVNAQACNAMADIRAQQGRMDEAVALLEKAKAADPHLVATYLNLAKLRLLKKQPDAALELYREILVDKPNDPVIHTAMAGVLEVLGRFDEAEKHFQQAIESKSPEAYLNYAGFLARRSRKDETLKVLDACLQANNNSLPTLVFKARWLAGIGDEAQSNATIQQIEAINRETAISTRLRIELAAKRMPEAEAVAAKFIELNPSSSENYTPLAMVHELQGDYAQAVTVIRRALEAEPSNTRARLRLGTLQVKLGDIAGATKNFDQIIATDPNPAQAYAARGVARLVGGDTEGAAKDYETALNIQSDIPLAHNNLAMIYVEKPGKTNSALQHALAAFALDGGNPSVLDTLGYVMLKTGHPQDALKILNHASTLSPEDKNIASHLNMAKAATK